jgi:LacI family transcriptional regulator
MRAKYTIMDICRETGLSIATVSRVLNDSPKVTRETRQKVQAAILKLGYTPNAAARHLSGKGTNAIGVIFHQMTSGFYSLVMSGIELAARSASLRVLITIAHHEDPERPHYYDMLNEARIDGLIVLDSTLDPKTISKLKSYDRPMVLIQKASDDPAVATVCSANEEGGYLAVKHLLSLGYRDLLLVKGPDEAEDSHLRMEGCRRALKESGLSPERVPTIMGRYSAHEALMAFRAYREKHGLPRALFSFNDDMALAIMKELRLTGVKVPEEVALVGFDGIDAADYMGLTTVQMPMVDLGQEAVRLLVARLRRPVGPAAHVVKPCALVVRESCGGAPQSL